VAHILAYGFAAIGQTDAIAAHMQQLAKKNLLAV